MLVFFDVILRVLSKEEGMDANVNKLALLWGEAQKKIANSYLKVT